MSNAQSNIQLKAEIRMQQKVVHNLVFRLATCPMSDFPAVKSALVDARARLQSLEARTEVLVGTGA
jgi:hypothetical protein